MSKKKTDKSIIDVQNCFDPNFLSDLSRWRKPFDRVSTRHVVSLISTFPGVLRFDCLQKECPMNVDLLVAMFDLTVKMKSSKLDL